MVRSARRVEFTDIQFEPRNGKVRLVYDIDGLVFNVHGIFHDAPELSDRIWEVCLGELGLACLVDVATASMARTCLSRAYNPDVKGHEAFTEATRALRLELIADHGLSKRLLSLACTWGATVSRLGVVPDTDDNRVLLLMGGGKDSLYAYELLRKCGYDVHCFYLTEARRSWQQLRRVYAAFRDEVPHHRAFLDVNRRGVIGTGLAQDIGASSKLVNFWLRPCPMLSGTNAATSRWGWRDPLMTLCCVTRGWR